MDRRRFLGVSSLATLAGCLGDASIVGGSVTPTVSNESPSARLVVWASGGNLLASHFDRSGQLVGTYSSLDELSSALPTLLRPDGNDEQTEVIFLSDDGQSMASSGPRVQCRGDVCTLSQSLNFPIGSLHFSAGAAITHVAGCISRTVPRVAIRLSDRNTGRLLFDLHIAAWRDPRTRNLCLGLYDSGSRRMINWCTCGAWRTIREAYSTVRDKLIVVLLAVGLSATVAAIAADVLASAVIVLMPVGL